MWFLDLLSSSLFFKCHDQDWKALCFLNDSAGLCWTLPKSNILQPASPLFLQIISKTPQTKHCKNYYLQTIPRYIFFLILPGNFMGEFKQQNLRYGRVVICTTAHVHACNYFTAQEAWSPSLRLALFNQSNATKM